MAVDREAFENDLIEQLRANGGVLTTGPFAGKDLLVLTSTGAKSGRPRRAILNFTRADGDYVVAASKGGSPTDPSWLRNLLANPRVTIEAEGRTMTAEAAVAAPADREILWERHVARYPGFAEYPARAGRVIPMVRLTPVRPD